MVKREIIEAVSALVDQPSLIRNISVIAHVDHGKSTLTDSLVARAGLISKQSAGTQLFTMSREDEKARGVTIKSSCVTMALHALPKRIKHIPVKGEWNASRAAEAAIRKKELNAKLFAPKTGNGGSGANASSSTTPSSSSEGGGSNDDGSVGGHAPNISNSIISMNKDNINNDVASISNSNNSEEVKRSSSSSPVALSSGETKDESTSSTAAVVAGAATGGIAKQAHLINLIDSPGHVDFSGEVTAALRLSDGCILVVDAVEGVGVQTSTVVRQAIADGVKPVLFINKLDRFIVELRADNETIYNGLCRVLESVNVTINTSPRPIGLPDVINGGDDWSVWPQRGNVSFGSGLQGWGFNLADFAKLHHERFGLSVVKMTKKLWGDNYFCPVANKWQTTPISITTGKRLPRAFCSLVLQPIRAMFEATLAGDEVKVMKFLSKINIKLPPKTFDAPIVNHDGTTTTTSSSSSATTTIATPDASSSSSSSSSTTSSFEAGKTKAGKERLRVVMGTWLPAADAMLTLIVQHLPSPIESMKYRVQHLYTGPQDDDCAMAMRNCVIGPLNNTSNGTGEPSPLMIYVSKMVPTGDHKRFIAIARIFSGRLRAGQLVRVQGPLYIPNTQSGKEDLHVTTISSTSLLFGPHVESYSPMNGYGPGMIIGLSGVDSFMTKSATITNLPRAYNMSSLRHSVSAMVRVAVTVEDARHLQKLIEGLRRLSRSDQIAQVWQSSTGEHMISAAGELHLQTVIRDLQEKYTTGCTLRISEPLIGYCESVMIGGDEAMAKSPNKHNRLTSRAEPLGDSFINAMSSSPPRISSQILRDGSDERKSQLRILSDELLWDINDARKIWSFGPLPGHNHGNDSAQYNVIVDTTRGLPFMNEIRDHVINGFSDVCRAGVLCDEPVRGVRWNMMDAKLHSDKAHRGVSQIIPATKRSLWAAQLRARPVLLEPMYLTTIYAPLTASAGIYQTLRARRATLTTNERDEWSSIQSSTSSDGKGTSGSGGDGGHSISVSSASVSGSLRSIQVQAYLPVSESFGFSELLRKNTSGEAFPSMTFSHWQVMKGDLYIDDEPITVSGSSGSGASSSLSKGGNHALDTVIAIRTRKGLTPYLPPLADFMDKL